MRPRSRGPYTTYVNAHKWRSHLWAQYSGEARILSVVASAPGGPRRLKTGIKRSFIPTLEAPLGAESVCPTYLRGPRRDVREVAEFPERKFGYDLARPAGMRGSLSEAIEDCRTNQRLPSITPEGRCEGISEATKWPNEPDART